MLLSQLSPASFRGARFLVPDDEAEEGRKAVHHNYPDAGHRYVEDNGLLLPDFSISAILHGPNVPAQLNALRAALNKPGPGVLKHPHYGTQFVQVDGTYKVKRSDKDAGVVTVDIKFAVTGAPFFPMLLTGIAAHVSSIAASAVSALFEAFSPQFGEPEQFSAATSATLVAAVETAGGVLHASFSAAGTGGAELVRLAAPLVANPDRLATALVTALRQPIDDDTYSEAQLIRGYTAMFEAAAGFVQDAAALPATTLDYQIRKQALQTIGVYTQAAAFVLMAEAMSARSYTTADDVAADEVRLLDALDIVQNLPINVELGRVILEVYVAASEVLDRALVRAPRLKDIRQDNIPASVLTYMLYDSEERLPQLVGLNMDQAPDLFTGLISVMET